MGQVARAVDHFRDRPENVSAVQLIQEDRRPKGLGQRLLGLRSERLAPLDNLPSEPVDDFLGAEIASRAIYPVRIDEESVSFAKEMCGKRRGYCLLLHVVSVHAVAARQRSAAGVRGSRATTDVSRTCVMGTAC